MTDRAKNVHVKVPSKTHLICEVITILIGFSPENVCTVSIQ